MLNPLKPLAAGIGVAVLAGTTLLNAAAYPDVVLGGNPLAYWRLNEAAPPADTFVNSGSLGAVANGTVPNIRAYTQAPGALAASTNKAVLFPGNQGFVQIPWSAALNPNPPFTVEAWVKPAVRLTGTTVTAPTASLRRSGSFAEGWVLYQTATNWNLRMGTSTNNYTIDIYGTTNPQTNTWYHLVATYDGTAATLYVNGVAEASTNQTQFNVNTNTAMGIGARGDAGNLYNGTVDEVAVYGKLLAPAQILAHYQNGTSASPAQPYDALVATDTPLGYWRLNEASVRVAPNSGTGGSAIDGFYTVGTVPGAAGPRPTTQPGFEASNTGAQLDGTNAWVYAYPLGVATNAMTIAAWVWPDGAQAGFSAIFFTRGGSSVNGLNYRNNNELGYHWNGAAATYNFGSALTVASNTWNFVAVVIEPARAIIYLNDGTGLKSATNNVAHPVVTWDGPTRIGWDSNSAGRRMKGVIDEVAVYPRALSEAEMKTLSLTGFGSTTPPEILVQPVAPAAPLETGATYTLSVGAAGEAPLTYQWRKGTADVSGATKSSLTLSNVTTADAGSYTVVVTGPRGNVTSDPAVVDVLAARAPVIVTAPEATKVYVSGTARFSVDNVGSLPYRYQWKKGSTAIADATNRVLTIPNAQTTDAGNYSVDVINSLGTTPTAAVALTVLTPATNTFEGAVVSMKPVAYWRLDEEVTLLSTNTVAHDYMGANHSKHVDSGGYSTVSATEGPRPTAYPGFESTNIGAAYDGFTAGTTGSSSLMNGLGQFSIVGWFKMNVVPAVTRTEPASTRVALFGQNDAAEFGFHGTNDLGIWTPNGGYVAFNQTNLVADKWYFIACRASGTNITFFLNGNAMASGGNATTNYGASGYPFNIGHAVLDATGNFFDGSIDDVALFNRALSDVEVNLLYSRAKGVTPAKVLQQPVSLRLLAGKTAQFGILAEGTLPISYQWRKGTTDIPNATNATLVITNVTAADQGDYSVRISNIGGNDVSQAANLAVVTYPLPPAGTYASAVAALGPIAYWQLDEAAGTTTAADITTMNPATHNATAVAGVEGPRPPAFPGFAATNSAVAYNGLDAGTATAGPLMNNLGQFSLVGWFNPAVMPQNNRSGLFGQNDVIEFGFHGTTELGIWTPNGGYVGYGTAALPTNAWHLAAVVGTGSGYVLYVDGAQVGTGGTAAANYGSANTPFCIGYGTIDANVGFHNGIIDEVAVYDRALQAPEITALWNAALGVKPDVKVDIKLQNGQVTLTWPSGTLQQSDLVHTGYADISPAPTSPLVITPTATQKYYRVRN